MIKVLIKNNIYTFFRVDNTCYINNNFIHFIIEYGLTVKSIAGLYYVKTKVCSCLGGDYFHLGVSPRVCNTRVFVHTPWFFEEINYQRKCWTRHGFNRNADGIKSKQLPAGLVCTWRKPGHVLCKQVEGCPFVRRWQ